MSIKHFHIFFVTLATLMALLVGLWGILSEAGRETPGLMVTGIICLLSVPVLIGYGIYFYRKIKHLSL